MPPKTTILQLSDVVENNNSEVSHRADRRDRDALNDDESTFQINTRNFIHPEMVAWLKYIEKNRIT